MDSKKEQNCMNISNQSIAKGDHKTSAPLTEHLDDSKLSSFDDSGFHDTSSTLSDDNNESLYLTNISNNNGSLSPKISNSCSSIALEISMGRNAITYCSENKLNCNLNETQAFNKDNIERAYDIELNPYDIFGSTAACSDVFETKNPPSIQQNILEEFTATNSDFKMHAEPNLSSAESLLSGDSAQNNDQPRTFAQKDCAIKLRHCLETLQKCIREKDFWNNSTIDDYYRLLDQNQNILTGNFELGTEILAAIGELYANRVDSYKESIEEATYRRY